MILLRLTACVALACGSAQLRFSNEELARIYIAALNAEVRADPPRAAAFNPVLMTDSGMYRAAGTMPPSVVERLRRQGVFSEICGVGKPTGTVPTCISQHAETELRVSRPIPRDTNAVDVYIGGGSIRPVRDTTSLFFSMGGTVRCRVVREHGRWVRKTCVTTMVV